MKQNVFEKTAIVILLTLLSTLSTAQDNKELQSFLDGFREAVEAKDIGSINAMNSWKGVPKELRAVLEKQFEEIIEKGILNLKLEHIENGEELEFGRGGNVFTPNIPPVAKINIEIPTNKNFKGGYSFYIGQDNGKYFFAHVVRQ